mgnify:CR=1 FL=1
MKKIFLTVLLCLSFFAPTVIFSQVTAGNGQLVELSPEELKIMIRKMAAMRRQRVIAWQYQQMQRQAAIVQQQAVNQQIMDRKETKANTENGGMSGQSPAGNDNSAELAEMRRRLDRQEDLLLEIRNLRAVAVQPSAPARTDTIIKKMMLEKTPDGTSNITDEDLDVLNGEMNRMKVELNTLRRRLADEEELRRRAEEDVYRARTYNAQNNGNERNNQWEAERLRYERERNRFLREEEDRRNDISPKTAPVIVERQGEVRIIRDTVVVDRLSTTPVYIPTEVAPDTVIILKETITEADPEVVKDTVVVDRERVRTDTLNLKATEPISFPTIFFDNNSSRLNGNHLELIAGAVEQLSGRSDYTLRLTGFASPSGNAVHNQQLSAKRAAAVREGFERAGLIGSRIIIVPGGIDFKPANAAAARRVEVHALPE